MSKEAELSVLSSMIMKNEAIGIVAEKLTTVMFTHQHNRDIFDKMIELDSKSIPVDDVQLKSMDIPVEYLLQVLDREPHGESAEYHADIVLESYKVAQIGILGAAVSNLAVSGKKSEEMYSLIEVALKTAEGDSKETGVQHASEVEVKFGPDDKQFIKTQFHELNEQIVGLGNGELIQVIGSTSMGKTSLMLDLFREVGYSQDIPTAFFSCEMSNRENKERMACTIANVSGKAVQNGYANSDQIDLLYEAARQLSDKPLFFDKVPGLTPVALRRKIIKVHRMHNIRLVFVDHLHRMRPSGKSQGRTADLAVMSKEIGDIATELGIPIVLGCQVNRNCATRDNKRPGLHDIRDCGEIEEAADKVIGVFRPSYYGEDGDDELIVLKGRSTGTGVIHVDFHGEVTSFKPMSNSIEQSGKWMQ